MIYHRFLGFFLLFFVQACIDRQPLKTKPLSSTLQKTEMTQNKFEKPSKEAKKSSVAIFPYDLTTPVEKYKLSKKLDEISGLDYMDEGKLVCVNDEKGEVYVYDLAKEDIIEDIDFEKNGDYEGIEWVGKDLYVLRSDGDLYQIEDFDTKNQKTTKYETHLSTGNDTEGLTYDEANNRLLIACKGSPGKADDLRGKKAIYAFQIATKQMDENPAITIDLKALRNWKGSDKLTEAYDKASEFFTGSSVTFNPSGIAIHPISKQVYVIATSGKLLIVLSPDGGTTQHIQPLDPDVFKQPEGITFADDGTLFISNEGRGGKANILKFELQK